MILTDPDPLESILCAYGGTMPGYVWNNPVANSNATGYVIQMSSDGSTWATADSITLPMQFTISGIANTSFDQNNPPSGTCNAPSGGCQQFVDGANYWWRVKAISGTCINSPWSLVATFSTNILGTPAFTAPTGNLCTEAPVFRWDQVTDATAYRIECTWIDPTVGSWSAVNQAEVFTVGGSPTLPDPANPTYNDGTNNWGISFNMDEYWCRVAARDNDCNQLYTDNWSNTINWVNYTVGLPPTNLTPDAVEYCASSANDTPVLQWDTCTRCTQYHVQVATDTTPTNLVINTEDGTGLSISGPIGTNTFDFQAVPSTVTSLSDQIACDTKTDTYFWRVRGTNVGGCDTGWTDWADFNFNILGDPIPQYPLTGLICNSIPTFQWDPAITDAGCAPTTNHAYEIMISTNNLSWFPVEKSDIILSATTTTWQPVLPGISNGNGYYWKIRSKDGFCDGNWKIAGPFDIQEIQGSPTPQNPLNTEKICDQSATFWFTAITGVTDYDIELEKEDDGVGCDGPTWSPVVGSPETTPNGTALPGDTIIFASSIILTSPANYRWRVRGTNPTCNGTYSNWVCFESDYLPQPNIADLGTVCTYSFDDVAPYYVRFVWDEIVNADTYDVQITLDTTTAVDREYTVNANTLPECDGSACTTGIVSNPLLFDPPYANKTYYWRVRANKPECPFGGEWSVWDEFIIDNVQDPNVLAGSRTTSLNSPPDEYYSCTNNVNLDYGPMYGATAYRVQISTDTNDWAGSQIEMIDPTSPPTNWGCSDPSCSGHYYWRVFPYNANCDGTWSDYRHFYFDKQELQVTLNGPGDMDVLCNVNPTDRDDTPVLSWIGHSSSHPSANVRYYIQANNDDNSGSELWNADEIDFTGDNNIYPYLYWVDTSVVNDTTYDLSSETHHVPPSDGHITYWRVYAQIIDVPSYTGCATGWSDIWRLNNRSSYMQPVDYYSYTNSTVEPYFRWCNSNDWVQYRWFNNTPWGANHDVYNAEIWDIELYYHHSSGYNVPGEGAAPTSSVGALAWSDTGILDSNTNNPGEFSWDTYANTYSPELTDDTYYWRVHGYNSDCNTNEWSQFTKVIVETIETPNPTQIISNNFWCYSPNPTLTWDAVTGAPETAPMNYQILLQRYENEATGQWTCSGSGYEWCQIWTWTGTSTSVEFPVDTIYPGSGISPSDDTRISGYYRWRIRAYTSNTSTIGHGCTSAYTGWQQFRIYNKEIPPRNQVSGGCSSCDSGGHGYFGCSYTRCNCSHCCTRCPWKFRGDDATQEIRWDGPPASNAFEIRIKRKESIWGSDQWVIGGSGNELYVIADPDWDDSPNNGLPDYPGTAPNWAQWVDYSFDLQDAPGGILRCGTYELEVRATMCDGTINGDFCLPPTAGVCECSGCWTDWSPVREFTVLEADDNSRYNLRVEDDVTRNVISTNTQSCSRQPWIVWDDARCSTTPVDNAGFNRYHVQIGRNSTFTSLHSEHLHGLTDFPLEWQTSPLFPNNCDTYYFRIRLEHGDEDSPLSSSCYYRGCQHKSVTYAPWSPIYRIYDRHLYDSSPIISGTQKQFYAGGCSINGNDANVCFSDPYFKWADVCSADLYDFQVSSEACIPAGSCDHSCPGSSVYDVPTFEANLMQEDLNWGAPIYYWAYSPLVHLENYFWRVRGKGLTSGCVGDWGPIWKFQVIVLGKPTVTGPLAPANKICGDTINATFTYPQGGEDGLHMQVCRSVGGCLPMDEICSVDVPTGSTSAQCTIPSVELWGTLYWRVSPFNPPCWGTYSDDGVISVQTIGTPTILGPPICDIIGGDDICGYDDCAAYYSSYPIKLTWMPLLTAFNYKWEIYSDAGLSTIVASGTSTTNSVNLTMPPLTECTDYWYRVRGWNPTCGDGPWSTETRHFKLDSYPIEGGCSICNP